MMNPDGKLLESHILALIGIIFYPDMYTIIKYSQL